MLNNSINLVKFGNNLFIKTKARSQFHNISSRYNNNELFVLFMCQWRNTIFTFTLEHTTMKQISDSCSNGIDSCVDYQYSTSGIS